MNAGPDAAAWSRYWASGHLHSCPNAFAGNYDDELRTFWLAFFAELPDGARVLDIGTGNGAVAFLARDAADAKARQFRIEGIDAAAIDPATAAGRLGIPLGSIVFRGEVRCERTDYPDGHFDAVSSQYTIEYTGISETLRELARIVRPGGRVGCVIHHGDSEAVASARRELKAFDYLLHDAPLLLESRQLLRRLASARTAAELNAQMNGRDARARRKEIEKQFRRIIAYAHSPQRGAGFLEDIARQVADALQRMRTTGPAAALRRLEALENEMAAHRLRLRAIVRAAHEPADIERFCKLATEAGFEPEGRPEELRRGGADLLGWVVRLGRVQPGDRQM